MELITKALRSFIFMLIFILPFVLLVVWVGQQPATLVYSGEGTYRKELSNGGVLESTWSEKHYTNTSWGDQSVYRSRGGTKYFPPNGGAPERVPGGKGIKDVFIINDLFIISDSTFGFAIRDADNHWQKLSPLKSVFPKLQEINFFYDYHGHPALINYNESYGIKSYEVKLTLDKNLEVSFNYSGLLFNYSFRFRLAKNGRRFELLSMTSVSKEKELISIKPQAEHHLNLKIPSGWVATKFSHRKPLSFALINLEVPNSERHVIRLIDDKTNIHNKRYRYCRAMRDELGTPISLKIDGEPFLLEKTNIPPNTRKRKYFIENFSNSLYLAEMVHGTLEIDKRNFYLCVYAKRINNQTIEDFLTQLVSLNSLQ